MAGERGRGMRRGKWRDSGPELVTASEIAAFVYWERYLANQECVRQHCSTPGTKGSPRNGSGLLTGLAVCGNCGRRLKTDHPAHGKAYYRCARHLYEATSRNLPRRLVAGWDDAVSRRPPRPADLLPVLDGCCASQK